MSKKSLIVPDWFRSYGCEIHQQSSLTSLCLRYNQFLREQVGVDPLLEGLLLLRSDSSSEQQQTQKNSTINFAQKIYKPIQIALASLDTNYGTVCINHPDNNDIKIRCLSADFQKQRGALFAWPELKGWTDFFEQAAILTQREICWHLKLAHAEELAYRDDLTDLHNQRHLNKILATELKRAHRSRSTFSLLFIDLDHFKIINDHFGHLTGSDILKQVGVILKNLLREIDVIVRYGGDEFVVILLDTDLDQAHQVAERIRMVISKTKFQDNGQQHHPNLQITASIGVASYPHDGVSREALLTCSDLAMYRAKESGRDCVRTSRDTTSSTISLSTAKPPSDHSEKTGAL